MTSHTLPTTDWQKTSPDLLIDAWRTGQPVDVRRFGPDGDSYTARVVDVRPYGGFSPAVILENGAFLSGQATGSRVQWRVAA